MRDRLKLFFTLIDSRFEDITRQSWKRVAYRDFSAGLIVALTAIPMAMGFAIAMGLRPEQGIIAGALACVVGRTFGGSKYQVYGPTAAFIPVIAGLITKYGPHNGGTAAEAHGFLVAVSIISGIILCLLGVGGLGRFARRVPNSIVVGFTVGIAVAIAASNMGEVLGLEADLHGSLINRLRLIAKDIHTANYWALALAVGTFAVTKLLLRISIFIPGPAVAIAIGTALSSTVLSGSGLRTIGDLFGSIPNNFFVFTPPQFPALTSSVIVDIVYFVVAIVFVSGVESLLCSSMADRLANNKGTPFNPDKEFFGQGLVQIITPMVNGFPCTGALARTATSIKAGAVSPLAGYFKAALKLGLAYFLAHWLELVPMACVGGILFWVASNMIKPAEVRESVRESKLDAAMLIYTAVMVPVTDFLTGVLSALIIYFVARKVIALRSPRSAVESDQAELHG